MTGGATHHAEGMQNRYRAGHPRTHAQFLLTLRLCGCQFKKREGAGLRKPPDLKKAGTPR